MQPAALRARSVLLLLCQQRSHGGISCFCGRPLHLQQRIVDSRVCVPCCHRCEGQRAMLRNRRAAVSCSTIASAVVVPLQECGRVRANVNLCATN
jgi:hypothetical protein